MCKKGVCQNLWCKATHWRWSVIELCYNYTKEIILTYSLCVRKRPHHNSSAWWGDDGRSAALSLTVPLSLLACIVLQKYDGSIFILSQWQLMGLFSCGPGEWWNSKQTFFLSGRKVLHHSDWDSHRHLCHAAITGGYGRWCTRSSPAGTPQRVRGIWVHPSFLQCCFLNCIASTSKSDMRIFVTCGCQCLSLALNVFTVRHWNLIQASFSLGFLYHFNLTYVENQLCQLSGLKCHGQSKLLYEEAPCKNLTPEGPLHRKHSSRHCCELSYRDEFATFALGPIILSPRSQERAPHLIWIMHIGGILAERSWLRAPVGTGWCHLLFSRPLVKGTCDAVAAPVIRAFLQPWRSSSRANIIRPPVYRHANGI